MHHFKVPIALLLLYDVAPSKFYDGEIGNRYKLSNNGSWIDEGNNGLPDLLDEAVWLINYYKRSKNVLLGNYGGTGGVPGYVGADGIPGNNMTAWEDNNREWRLSGECAEATYSYAGLAAWYATCLNEFHKLSNSGDHPDYYSWMHEAKTAYTWAENNPQDTDLSKAANQEYRNKGFAAAALYRLTGESKYQNDFKTYLAWEPWAEGGEWSNQNVYDFSISIFSMIPDGHPNLDNALKTTCVNEVIRKADQYKVTNNQNNAFRMGIEYSQFMQLGGINTPRLTLVPVAHLLTGDNKYTDVVHNSMNYSLGGNQLNMTYLSGLGEESDRWVFSPNGWLTGDKNSMVYPNEPYIGYTSYFGATSYWFTQSAFSEYFSRQASHPYILNSPNVWPETEAKFYNMYSIQGGEFTVHQQNNYMIYATGYRKALANPGNGQFRVSGKPTTNLNLTDNQVVSASSVDLTISNPSSTIRSVKYYYDWHFIGESDNRSTNFKVNWDAPLAEGTKVLITAVAFDDHGRIGEPSANGDKYVYIGTASNPDPAPSPAGGVFQQASDGLVSMEAENFSSKANGSGNASNMSWTEHSDGNAAGDKYMMVPDNSNTSTVNGLSGPKLDFKINFTKTGTHYVWVRQKSPNGSDNSIICAYNSSKFFENNLPESTTWIWSKLGTTFTAATGEQTFSVHMREDGTPIDKIVISTNTNYNPTGEGPAESAKSGDTPPPPSGGVSYNSIYLEAEDGSVESPMAVGTASSASGGQFVSAPASTSSNNSAPTTGKVTFTVNLKGGAYKIWGRVRKPGNGDSFWVQVDGGAKTKWNDIVGAANTWTWDSVHDTDSSSSQMTYNLSAGEHTITFYYREGGTELDQIYVTNEGDTPTAGARLAQESSLLSPEAFKLSVYPNPSNGLIYLDATRVLNAKVIVYNSVGQVISTQALTEQRNQIQLPSKGMYLVKVVENNNTLAVERVLVK